MTSPSPVPVAYGMSLAGPLVDDELRSLLAVDTAPWPRVTLRWKAAATSPANENLEDDRAMLRCLFGGYLVADRVAMSATFRDRTRPDPHVLAHPGLAGVGLIFARWLGRSAFHAGLVLASGGAWGVTAIKGKGKTTTLAALALAGHEVLADDIAVIDGTSALAGPRTLDLRPSAAERLEGDFTVLSVRGAQRRRLVLGPIVASAPLRGWIHLGLAPRLVVEPVPPAQRLAMLGEHLAVRLVPRDPTAFLDVAMLPAYRIGRPLSWRSLSDVVSAIEEITTGHAAAEAEAATAP